MGASGFAIRDPGWPEPAFIRRVDLSQITGVFVTGDNDGLVSDKTGLE
jgi:hypothetical protein